MDVSGRTAIVTGGSRGIGKQIALELGRRGANVVVVARTLEAHRRLPGTIGETVELIKAGGGHALGIRADLRELDNIHTVVQDAVDHFGGVDVLVNNAADTAHASPSVADLDTDVWMRHFDINLHAPFSLIRSVMPIMAARGGGVIVNMTSGDAELTPVRDAGGAGTDLRSDMTERLGERVAYGPSKAALNRLTNVIAPELRDLGIAIVAVDPGFTRTELVELMAEHGMVDRDAAKPMDVTVRGVLDLISLDDPMAFTGQVVRAEQLTQRAQ
jgi:NAD(P)-dependent dehydrogenase (short-subunit alcohol dehydrogenase family)